MMELRQRQADREIGGQIRDNGADRPIASNAKSSVVPVHTVALVKWSPAPAFPPASVILKCVSWFGRIGGSTLNQ